MLVPLSAWAQRDHLEESIALLHRGEFEAAHESFLQELAGAKGEGELEVRFYLGLSRQQQAQVETDDAIRRSHLAEAALEYERALEIDPNRGSVLNNLAQVYANLGRDSDAEPLFERSVTLEVPLRPFFHRNFGDFLTRRGDWKRAAENYRQTLEERPDDRQAQTSLVEILSQHHPEALPEYLWFLIGKGQMLEAEDEALNRLEMSNAPQSQGEEYLAILVAALAQQSYLPEEFSSSHAAHVLGSLSGQSDIGEGAREVLAVHESTNFDPGKYSWWAERGRPIAATRHEPSPREAFRHLLRSLGDALHTKGRNDAARSYFRLAILLTQDEPDLLTFRKLVNLPSSQGDVAAIDRLVDGNEKLILNASPKQADLSLYRHDLGLFYGFLKHWRGEGPASGIYQLSEATHMGGVGPPDGPPDTPTFDARIYTRLAAGYTDTGEPERARRVLFDLVAAYRSHGMNAEADAMLAMLNSGRSRYRPLDRRREPFDDPPFSLRDFTTQPPGPPQ